MKQLRNFKKTNSIPDEFAHNRQMQDAISKYGNLDENALVDALIQNVKTQRQNGTYSQEQMTSYVQMLSPHLSHAQKEKLENIINIISNENV